jgi:hypothetical protein
MASEVAVEVTLNMPVIEVLPVKFILLEVI